MLLEVKALEVGYGGIRAVKGIDLEVDEGELVCLIGANGAGKSTTLRAICGLLPVRGGSVRYAGTDTAASAVHELPRTGNRPQMARRVVLLPAPFAPMRHTSSPSSTWRSMPFTARIPP